MSAYRTNGQYSTGAAPRESAVGEYTSMDDVVTSVVSEEIEEAIGTRDGEHFVKSVRFVRRVHSDDPVSTSETARTSDEFSVASSTHSAPSSGFSRRNEQAVSINMSARNYTKLEVIKAKDISKMLWWIHGVIAFALLFCVLIVVLMNTAFLKVAKKQDINGFEGLQARYYRVPTNVDIIFTLGNMLCFVAVTSLAVVYTRRIAGLRRRDRTHEQVWVIMLTIAAALYMNPFENVVRLLEKIGINAQKAKAYRELALFYDSIKDAAFSASTLFYIWASVHSYRILNGKLGAHFYLPKVSAVVLYVLLKLVAYWSSRVYFSEMPFVSMIGLLYLFRIIGIWKLSSVLWVSFITLYEFLLVGCIFYDIHLTRQFLSKNDYMESRTKQIGFRFFLYHNSTFYILFWLCYIMLLLSLPPGAQIATQRVLNIVYVELHSLPLGLYVFYLSYVTVEAFANLPADAIGLRGWLHPQAPHMEADVEPIMYRKREPKGVSTPANTLTMETVATLFNFSWLAYYYDTDKMTRLKGRCAANFEYDIVDMISNHQTDTHALIVDGSDRIIVTFQGTKSFKNLMTDINAFHTKLNRVLPTGSASLGSSELWDSNAKVHRGFADAYMGVSERVIESLRAQYHIMPRPIYFAGYVHISLPRTLPFTNTSHSHSLGGALATLCALDCLINLNLDAQDVFVSTFGAPRVGNRSFQRIYDEHIPAHWRVVNAPDLIPSLPKVGYAHVGKKVLLTVTGDLFIDPNSMELSLWGKRTQSLLYHRKSAYLLAMKSWCRRHDRGSYRAPFWKWPVTEDDNRRFPDADPVPLKGSDMGRRILRQDAMIDALDMQTFEDGAVRAVCNWQRLVRRALLQEKLGAVV